MFEQAFRNIDDVLRKEAGCTTELDYTEQSSWLLFLKYLAGLEEDKATEAQLEGKKYAYILDKPYRWETWAAPKGKDGKLDHNAAMTGDDLRDFVNGKLFSYLHGFKQRATGSDKLEGLREETQRLESIYQQKIAALEALKKSLLHQAFTGQL
jgi:type I restriction enzyme M protein